MYEWSHQERLLGPPASPLDPIDILEHQLPLRCHWLEREGCYNPSPNLTTWERPGASHCDFLISLLASFPRFSTLSGNLWYTFGTPSANAASVDAPIPSLLDHFCPYRLRDAPGRHAVVKIFGVLLLPTRRSCGVKRIRTPFLEKCVIY